MFDSQQRLHPALTSWHITWGTYATRLHGGMRATVDCEHNHFGEQFIGRDADREQREVAALRFPPVQFTARQREFIEAELPSICERGGWAYRIAAAGADHVHLLCDVPPEVHGEKVRRLVKRWLGQALSERWPLPEGAAWWAEQGSNKAIREESYLDNAYRFVFRQRATRARS
jgi:REP element-mobilizing transposase RayT